jgi:C-terminal processing protease CtpA/Prc
MKTILIYVAAVVALLLPSPGQTSLRTESFQQGGDPSGGSQASSKSVTVTSDGKTTVKKTVTVVNGVRKVVIETTDENGKTTRTESGGNQEQAGSDPWIGLKVSEVPAILRDQLGLARDEGLAVDLVADDGPAGEAGVQKGDLLLKIAGKGVASEKVLSETLSIHRPGDEVDVMIMRKAERMELKVKLAKTPPENGQAVPEELLKGLEKSSVKSVDVEVTGEGFDALLDNPELPESFKQTIREMQKSLREFEKKKE